MSYQFTKVSWLLLCGTLTGCGIFEKIDRSLPDNRDQYKESATIPALEYPPTITDPSITDELLIPNVTPKTTTRSDYDSGKPPVPTGQLNSSAVTHTTAMPAPRDKPPVVDLDKTVKQSNVVVLPELNEIEVKRDGNSQWLAIHATPEQIWTVARQFWLKNNFELELDAPALGVLQTKWIEDSSTSTRNRYRMRLERNADMTELYVSHQGTKRVRVGDDYVWQPLIWLSEPSNKELENEILKRMLVYFGVQDKFATTFTAQQTTSTTPTTKAELQQQADGLNLLVKSDFDTTWRDTGIALDRIGFSVDKRDKTNRVYLIRYADATQVAQDKSLLDTIFGWGSSTQTPTQEYLIFLMSDKDNTRIAVLNKKGSLENSKTAEQILSLLRDQLR
ncbi:outer membrane protein assembly factor BamC [Beggiatoa leptomitoformis]|uniref:Outer membrane protein assembly factor BamC n=1 Tax=Beggiatoa leptomitoformis TaxID=288004 RepID=A0A2N9YJ01_9GAMM|nr:outer membrane protein assembly factor BamC [Beggiatoa leptomitoformis]ALG67458.1 outer membrane protein assembly factor BamC [Beggiatoa leptomitoformis]AUI70325.1 outer membrane protein assembly factor BamC [Beggiatoa leptomitoformis]